DGEEAVSDPLGGSDFPQKIFSPNGDGIGDNWIINPDVSLVENCELVIFDNRGIEVYAAKPYQNDWQGTYNGKELPEGVYFYIIKCEGNSKSYSGSITLLK
ncbi:MAG: gliding motility-associated C-terminal domain-containing protein, partial [Fulvivirga sp.]